MNAVLTLVNDYNLKTHKGRGEKPHQLILLSAATKNHVYIIQNSTTIIYQQAESFWV